MAAGLGFKDFTTGEVLTAADVDGYLMQGIWVFANATARDAAVTSPQEGNSCYLKDTDVIQVYSGSSWVVKSGGSSPLTTKGDLYTYSTTDTRLASSGVNNDVLTVDTSTATGLKWAAASAGGMTLLSTTTLSGASVTIGSIPSGYQQLLIRGFDITNNTAAGYLRATPTGSTNICSYVGVIPAGTAADRNQTYIDLIGDSGNPYFRNGGNNIFTLTIDNYASTTAHKSFFVYAGGEDNINSFYGGYIKTDSAITSLDFDNTGGTFSAGTIQIYGVK